MKSILLPLFCCIPFCGVHGGDEPLIPFALNNILPNIHAGMTVAQLEAVLSTAYPNVKGRMDSWSGQTGYIAYQLDERFTLSVSSITRNETEVVHDDLLFYLTNFATSIASTSRAIWGRVRCRRTPSFSASDRAA